MKNEMACFSVTVLQRVTLKVSCTKDSAKSKEAMLQSLQTWDGIEDILDEETIDYIEVEDIE